MSKPLPFVEFDGTLLSVEDLGDGLKIYRFGVAGGGDVPFDFVPGQYVQMEVTCECCEDKTVRRSYSIASAPSEKTYLEFVIQTVEGGACTPVLDKLNEGDEVPMRGPIGHFVIKDNDRPKAFIAAGTGIGPIASMVRELEAQRSDAEQTLLYGTRTKSSRAYADEYEAWAKDAKHDYRPMVSREEPTEEGCQKGRVTDILKDLFSENADDRDYYICGPPAMVKDAKEQLKELGATSIAFEAYG